MLDYNSLVEDAFLHPKFILPTDKATSSLKQAQAGDRPHGIWFSLFFDQETQQLFYKVYGSPYAIAAVETIARQVADGELKLGQALDSEALRRQLEMPFPYMNVLIALEDAWLALDK